MIQVNFKRLIALLLPYKLRTRMHIAWLMAMYAPLRTIYTAFAGKRATNLYTLSITPQVCYLEKMLNDRYDDTQRRIYIGDAERVERQYIYLPDEQKDVFISLASENKPYYIHTQAEITAGEIDFVVYVPAAVPYNDKEMQALLDSYKLASKAYKIATV